MKLPNTLNNCVVKKDNFYIEKDEVNEIVVKFFSTSKFEYRKNFEFRNLRNVEALGLN